MRIKVYHFYNGTGGGVLSVIRNLLHYSTNNSIENHVIHTVNQDMVKEYISKKINGAVTEKVFYYSARWNFYYTCSQLAKLIPDENAVIVAHDWLELGMVSNLGLQNPVVQLLHGNYNYYYDLAVRHRKSIDRHIAVANDIAKKMRLLLPERKIDINYLRFPVHASIGNLENKQSCNIIFVGRLTKDKGYHLLPLIDSILKQRNVFLHWNIVGEHMPEQPCEVKWDSDSSVKFYGSIDNCEVFQIHQKMNFFILPSIAEGMPVALIESMMCGVIPLVNNMEGGISELVDNKITGFKIEDNNPVGYVEAIIQLIENKIMSKAISQNCIEIAHRLFNPQLNTKLIEAEICNLFMQPRQTKNAVKVYGSRLDQKWLPNFFTKAVRSFNS